MMLTRYSKPPSLTNGTLAGLTDLDPSSLAMVLLLRFAKSNLSGLGVAEVTSNNSRAARAKALYMIEMGKLFATNAATMPQMQVLMGIGQVFTLAIGYMQIKQKSTINATRQVYTENRERPVGQAEGIRC